MSFLGVSPWDISSWSSVLRVSHLPVCSPLPRAVLWGTPWAHLYPDSLTTLSYYYIWLPHLYTAFPVTLLAAISKNGPHRLICLNTVSGLGRMALLEEVCHTEGAGFGFQHTHTISGVSLPVL